MSQSSIASSRVAFGNFAAWYAIVVPICAALSGAFIISTDRGSLFVCHLGALIFASSIVMGILSLFGSSVRGVARGLVFLGMLISAVFGGLAIFYSLIGAIFSGC